MVDSKHPKHNAVTLNSGTVNSGTVNSGTFNSGYSPQNPLIRPLGVYDKIAWWLGSRGLL